MIPKKLLLGEVKKSIIAKGKRGSSKRPRLAVFRSNRFLTAQLIDDSSGKTIVYVSQKELKAETVKSLKPLEIAELVGELVAQKAAKINIKTAIFDRRKYRYHGRIRNIAEGARKGGLKI